MKTEFLDRKAVSPVIATVILVSVTIVVAVAVAYWMGGIAGIYTRFEKVEIESCSTEKEPTTYTGWFVITIRLKNTGSADATVTNVYINGKILADYGDAYVDKEVCTGDPIVCGYQALGEGLTIAAGDAGNLRVYIPTSEISSGTTIEIKLHTAAGMDYPKLETLP